MNKLFLLYFQNRNSFGTTAADFKLRFELCTASTILKPIVIGNTAISISVQKVKHHIYN